MPWTNLSTIQDGNVLICCKSNGKFKLNHAINFINRKIQLLNLKTNSIDEIMNSDTFKKVRLKMLNGEWPSQCSQCLEEEKKGIESFRIYFKKIIDYKFNIEDALKITETDGSIKVNLKSIELRFSNKCNLKCRICKPFNSIKLKNEYLKINNELFNYFEQIDNNEILLEEKIWDNLFKSNEELSHIYIGGGEPLILKKQWDFLKYLINNNLSKNISLWYSTNTTYLPDYAFDIWKNFKNVFFNLSIDDLEKRCEYLRYGLKWNNVLNFLNKIKNNKDISCKICITPTITWLNIHYYDEFINFFKDFNICNNYLYFPDYLSPWILPDYIKIKIIDKHKNLHNNNNFIQFQTQIINNNSNIELFKKGIQFNKILDNSRNQNFKLIFPEYYDMIKKYWDE